MGMNVNLTPQLEEQDRLKDAKLEQLRGEIRRGLDSGPSETWDTEAVKRKARTRRASTPAAA